MKIVDNFVDQDKFDELQNLLMGNTFPWFYSNGIDGPDYAEDKNKFQFYHIFYMDIPNSAHFKFLNPILDKMDPLSLKRIKANLLTKTSKIVENTFHVDLEGISEEKMKQWTTSIFYMNTNNGYTKFEDGTEIESVANRLVSFPADMKHTGTSCTDEKTRVIINFNYFE